MYAVVGCGDCSALWVVEGRPDTTRCPRCGTRHRYRKLKRFVTTEDEDHAREVRASMLAARQGHGEAFAELDSFADLDRRLDADDVGVTDEEYLERSGVDTDAVADAGDRAREGAGGAPGSGPRDEVVRSALAELDRPDAAAVADYAAERGVPRSAARDLLDRLVRRGEAVETDEGYRPL